MGNIFTRIEPNYTVLPREIRAIIIAHNTYVTGDNSIRRCWGYFKDDSTREPYLLFIPKLSDPIIHDFIKANWRGFRLWHNILIENTIWYEFEFGAQRYLIGKLCDRCKWKIVLRIFSGQLRNCHRYDKYYASLNVRVVVEFTDKFTYIDAICVGVLMRRMPFDLIIHVDDLSEITILTTCALKRIGENLTELIVRKPRYHDRGLIEQLTANSKRLKSYWVGE